MVWIRAWISHLGQQYLENQDQDDRLAPSDCLVYTHYLFFREALVHREAPAVPDTKDKMVATKSGTWTARMAARLYIGEP